MWFLNRSDSNRAVQAQKLARDWKFCLYKVGKNKCADQHCCYCKADQVSHMQIVGFLMRRHKCKDR